jgi:hypothetical protein
VPSAEQNTPGRSSRIKPFQFTVRGLFWTITIMAVACGVMRALGPRDGILYARIGVPWAVFLLQSWQLTKFGPKGLGLLSLLAIMALKFFLWQSIAARDTAPPSWFTIVFWLCLILSLVVTWLYTAIRAILTRTSPNCEMGLLSLIWLFDAHVLLLFDGIQADLCTTWAPGLGQARPFRALLDFLWSG